MKQYIVQEIFKNNGEVEVSIINNTIYTSMDEAKKVLEEKWKNTEKDVKEEFDLTEDDYTSYIEPLNMYANVVVNDFDNSHEFHLLELNVKQLFISTQNSAHKD